MGMAKGVQQESLFSVMKLATSVHPWGTIRLERRRQWASPKEERHLYCMERIRPTAMPFKEEYLFIL